MKFHDALYAQEYDSRLAQEGYPGLLLDAVKPLLTGRTILEVGSGSGFFSIPLMESGFTLHALEPSKAMLNLFKNKIKHHHQYKIINSSWEDFIPETTDNILSAHSIYPIGNIEESLLKMLDASSNIIIIVRVENGRITISDELRKKYKKNKHSINFNDTIVKTFNNKNIPFNVYNVLEKKIIEVSNIDEESKYYSHHIGSVSIENIKKDLLNLCNYNSEKNIYEFNTVNNDNIYHIKL